MICGPGGSKTRLAKTAGAEPPGQMRDEKLHAVGAKRISKSKCTKHTKFRARLEVAMLKKWTLLWREARFKVKMHKALQPWTTFGSCHVKKVKENLWREAHVEVKSVEKLRGSAGARDSAP